MLAETLVSADQKKQRCVFSVLLERAFHLIAGSTDLQQ